MMDEQSVLSGLQVLIVEDAFLVAMDLSESLKSSGCEVIGPTASVEQALKRIEGVALDGAVLDVNLAGERSFPIAKELAARGVPFLFLTGYDSSTIIPDEFRHVPKLSKPVDTKVLTSAVACFRTQAQTPGKG